MKAPFFAFAAILSILCSCADISGPNPPNPRPEPSPAQFQGPWLIRQKDDQGRVVREWEVRAYKYSMFDRAVEFKDSAGNAVRLTGSFQIVQKP